MAAGCKPPEFDSGFRERFVDLLLWRRDVRHFKREPLPEDSMDHLLRLACLAPSVGLSQPWRFVLVEHPEKRKAIRENFASANASALASYEGEKAGLYASLKLARP